MTHEPAKGTPTMLETLDVLSKSKTESFGKPIAHVAFLQVVAQMDLRPIHEALVKLVQEMGGEICDVMGCEAKGHGRCGHNCLTPKECIRCRFEKIIGMPKEGGEDGRI